MLLVYALESINRNAIRVNFTLESLFEGYQLTIVLGELFLELIVILKLIDLEILVDVCHQQKVLLHRDKSAHVEDALWVVLGVLLV